MALKQTVNEMHQLLSAITQDLQKAEGGNKAAAQRVRTGTIRLEKTAKKYRKESIADEKKSNGSAKKAAKPAAKKPAAKAATKPAAKAPAKPAAKAAAKKVVAKSASKKAVVRTRNASHKRVATARHPAR